MVLPGHLAGGYISATIIFNSVNYPFSVNELTLLYLIGILAGELPDLDLAIFYLAKKIFKTTKTTHRDFVTHLPIFWIIISAIIFSVGYLVGSIFITTSSILILTGVFSHFILDSVDYGIQWLRPFSQRRFCIFKLSGLNEFESDSISHNVEVGSIKFYWNYLWKMYIKQPSFYAEIFVTLIALLIFLNQ